MVTSLGSPQQPPTCATPVSANTLRTYVSELVLDHLRGPIVSLPKIIFNAELSSPCDRRSLLDRLQPGCSEDCGVA